MVEQPLEYEKKIDHGVKKDNVNEARFEEEEEGLELDLEKTKERSP